MKRRALTFVLLLLVLVTLSILIGCSKKTSTKRKKISSKNNQRNNNDEMLRMWSRDNCKGKGAVKFGTSPMRLKDIGVIIPYGLMIDAHVTPIDHQYFSPADFNSPRDKYEVRAIADSTIVAVEHRGSFVGAKGKTKKTDEYQVVFQHSCTFFSYFDLLTSLAPDIKAKIGNIKGQNRNFSGSIPVKEGQLIGRIGGQTLDFGVYNADVRLGFVNPDSYKFEPWKIHTDKTFKYFKEPVKSQLIAKNIRKVKPIDGKIDYDIDGKLVGNWFRKDTRGYTGTNKENYWKNHLSVVYDYIDPNQIIVSIGDFAGEPKQFGVMKKTPDPAKVDTSTGLVKYELVDFEYVNKDSGQRWNATSVIANVGIINGKQTRGTILLQLIKNRELKVEVFPGKSASEVNGFSNNAYIYVR